MSPQDKIGLMRSVVADRKFVWNDRPMFLGVVPVNANAAQGGFQILFDGVVVFDRSLTGHHVSWYQFRILGAVRLESLKSVKDDRFDSLDIEGFMGVLDAMMTHLVEYRNAETFESVGIVEESMTRLGTGTDAEERQFQCGWQFLTESY